VLVRPLEERLREHPDVHECVLYGTGRPFLTAIVSPATPAVNETGLKRHLDEMNRTALPEQQIRGLVVATEPFSIENELLTSQFKPKRREIHRRYAQQIDSRYQRDHAG